MRFLKDGGTVLILTLAIALSGCAAQLQKLETAYQVVTSASVSPTMVYIAANVFDGLEASATNYLKLPKCGSFPCRSPDATVKIIPAIRAGRVARNNLEAFLIAHPGQLGSQGDYDALIAATNTLQSIYSQYGIK